MKKFCQIVLFTFFLSICCFVPINSNTILADVSIVENNSSGIVDENLYNALLTEVNSNLPSENQIEVLYENSLRNITDGILNLSNKNITNLKGLNLLSFSNINEINLSYNNITNISQNVFLTCTNLKNLNISNNKLNNIDISLLTNLEELNASNNKLTEVDLSKLKGTLISNFSTIKLNNNSLSSIDKIILPSEEINAYNIDLRYNKLNDFVMPTSIHSFDIGIQGVANNQTILSGTAIYLYDVLDNYENFIAKIYTNNTDYLTQLNSTNNNLLLSAADNYKIKFFDGTDEIIDNEKYNSINFTVKPNIPNVRAEIDGIEYNKIEKLTQETVLRFYGAGTIYFKVNNGEWFNANSLTLSEKGVYNINAKCVQNNIESDILSFTIPLEYPADTIKKILGFVLLGALILVLGYLAINYRKGIRFFKKNAKKKNNKQGE